MTKIKIVTYCEEKLLHCESCNIMHFLRQKLFLVLRLRNPV